MRFVASASRAASRSALRSGQDEVLKVLISLQAERRVSEGCVWARTSTVWIVDVLDLVLLSLVRMIDSSLHSACIPLATSSKLKWTSPGDTVLVLLLINTALYMQIPLSRTIYLYTI